MLGIIGNITPVFRMLRIGTVYNSPAVEICDFVMPPSQVKTRFTLLGQPGTRHNKRAGKPLQFISKPSVMTAGPGNQLTGTARRSVVDYCGHEFGKNFLVVGPGIAGEVGCRVIVGCFKVYPFHIHFPPEGWDELASSILNGLYVDSGQRPCAVTLPHSTSTVVRSPSGERFIFRTILGASGIIPPLSFI